MIPVSFKNLILPEKFPAPTKLFDLHPRLVSEMAFEEAEELFTKTDRFTEFSSIQSQSFDKLYTTDESVFIGAPSGGSERRILAELALLREIQKDNFGKIVYLSAKEELCRLRYDNWNRRLGEKGLGLSVEMLSSDFSGQQQADL